MLRVTLLIISTSFCISCTKPIAVTHWTSKDKAMLKKGRTAFRGKKPYGYPSHKWFSRVICFDELCRRKAEWVRKQRNDRFKGFKDGGKLPPPPPRHSHADDTTVLVASQPPSRTQPAQQQAAASVIEQPAKVETAKADSLIVLNEVLFAVNSYRLRPELYPKLDSIVVFLKSNRSTRIEISGHTDATGNESHNRKLSENRADAVAEYLVDAGIETSRVSFNGYGSSRPIAPNENEEGRRKNRRVEILIHSRQ